MKNLDMDLIFNKLTEKGICKFVSLYNLDGQKSCNKETLKKFVKESMGENSLFEFIPEEKFLEYYRNTEEAGQKHFYFYKLDMNENILQNINHFKNFTTNENDRNFKTINNDDEWFYSEKNDELTFKLVNVKEVYQYDKTLDNNDKIGFYFKGYRVKTIQNVLFFRFLLKDNKVIIGIDKYSDLDTPSDIRKKLLVILI